MTTSVPHPTAAPVALSNIPPCGDDNQFFSVPPIRPQDFMGLVPLGNVAPSAHVFPTDHMYFHINRIDTANWDRGTVQATVYAPGDMWVTQINSTLDGGKGRTDYGMAFSPCREVSGFFIHMTSLAPRLQNAVAGSNGRCNSYQTGGDTYEYCITSVSVKVSAGETIGAAGGDPFANALDLGLYDSRLPPLPFARPARWRESTTHIACPLDYFTMPARNTLLAKTGSHDGITPRTIEPVCGTIEQDTPGTAQGAWFRDGTPVSPTSSSPEDPHLALIHDVIDPSLAVFSVGASIPSIPIGIYHFLPVAVGAVNRDFGDVTPSSGVQCFDGLTDMRGRRPALIILLQLADAETLHIQGVNQDACGAGPWLLTAPSTFQR